MRFTKASASRFSMGATRMSFALQRLRAQHRDLVPQLLLAQRHPRWIVEAVHGERQHRMFDGVRPGHALRP
jgi:hypothetical protein